LSTI
jgi:hypothetical protein